MPTPSLTSYSNDGQPARIDRVDRRVLAVQRRRTPCCMSRDHVGRWRTVAASSERLRRAGIAAIRIADAGHRGARIAAAACGRSAVNPSLTKMIDLRPSRRPPILIAAPLSASMVIWLRTCSTTAPDSSRTAPRTCCAACSRTCVLGNARSRDTVLGAIAAEAQIGDRRQRIHDRHHVGRRELVLDEVDERLAHRHVVAAPHVVIVEQDHEQPHVRARGFALLVEVVLDRAAADRSISVASGRSSRPRRRRSSAACRLRRPRSRPA